MIAKQTNHYLDHIEMCYVIYLGNCVHNNTGDNYNVWAGTVSGN